MNALVSTVTQKGQVTIPKNVRESLHLVTGDKVEFIRNGQGEIVIQPITRKVSEVAGFLRKYRKVKPVSIEEMDQAIAQHTAVQQRLKPIKAPAHTVAQTHLNHP